MQALHQKQLFNILSNWCEVKLRSYSIRNFKQNSKDMLPLLLAITRSELLSCGRSDRQELSPSLHKGFANLGAELGQGRGGECFK